MTNSKKKATTRRRGGSPSDAKLDKMIEEAIVDAADESEQTVGFYTLLEHLPTPPPIGADWIMAFRRWVRGGG